jgi:hypothetical protein
MFTIMFQSRTVDVRLLKILPVQVEKLAVIYFSDTVCMWTSQKKTQNVKISFAAVPLNSIAYKYPKKKQHLGSPWLRDA